MVPPKFPSQSLRKCFGVHVDHWTTSYAYFNVSVYFVFPEAYSKPSLNCVSLNTLEVDEPNVRCVRLIAAAYDNGVHHESRTYIEGLSRLNQRC